MLLGGCLQGREQGQEPPLTGPSRLDTLGPFSCPVCEAYEVTLGPAVGLALGSQALC